MRIYDLHLNLVETRIVRGRLVAERVLMPQQHRDLTVDAGEVAGVAREVGAAASHLRDGLERAAGLGKTQAGILGRGLDARALLLVLLGLRLTQFTAQRDRENHHIACAQLFQQLLPVTGA